ncbi:LPS translocon maturation chaperone LptM [Legionella wadsworthii]|nr:lipoprotein [Legionella wadsworthii]
MKNINYFILVCLAIFLLSCGQKGPLYLPETKKPEASHLIQN